MRAACEIAYVVGYAVAVVALVLLSGCAPAPRAVVAPSTVTVLRMRWDDPRSPTYRPGHWQLEECTRWADGRGPETCTVQLTHDDLLEVLP